MQLTKKDGVAIAVTVLVMVLSCVYLYRFNAAYDGALLDSMWNFYVFIPIVGGCSLWEMVNGEGKAPTKQKWWQKVLTVLLILAAIALVAYELVAYRFYNLSAVVMAVYLLSMAPFVYFEQKRQGKPPKHPVRSWAAVMTSLYLLVVATVAIYVQVVQPVSVDQATAIVAAEYGNYEYRGHLTGDRQDTPLGIYWFSHRYDGLPSWVEVDLLTGEVRVL